MECPVVKMLPEENINALHKQKHRFPTGILRRSFTKVSCRKKAATGQEWMWSHKLMTIFKKDMTQRVQVSDQFSQLLMKGNLGKSRELENKSNSEET